MFIVSGRCPVCYASWNDNEFCSACGCASEILYEKSLPPKEHVNVQRVQNVIDSARKRLMTSSNEGNVHYALGLSYIHLDLIEEGLVELKRAAELLPEKFEIRYEVCSILVEHSLDINETFNQLNIVLKRNPEYKQALYLRGIIFEKNEKIVEALKDWQLTYQIDNQYTPASKRLTDFVSSEHRSLDPANFIEDNLDDTSREYLKLLTTPKPTAPPPLGETSMGILRVLSEDAAQRIEQMHGEVIREYKASLSKRNRDFKKMKRDLLGLSRLCVANLEARHNRQAQQQIQSKPAKEPLTIQERSAILEQTIIGYQKSGYRLVSRTETTAQLYRPKQFSCCTAIIMVLLIIGIVLYLIYYLTKKDDSVYLEIDEYGRVKTTRT